MAAGAGGTTGCSTGRRHAAVRKVGRDGRRARPCLISRLVDRRPYRRRQPGTRLRHGRAVRSGHIPSERENNAYQHGADGGGEPRPTAGAEEPSRSRPSMHSISPWHGNAAYQRAEATRATSSEDNYSMHDGPQTRRLAAQHQHRVRTLSRRPHLARTPGPAANSSSLRPYEEQMKKYSTANFELTNGIFVLTCVLMTLRSFRSDMLCFQLCEAGKEAFILK